MPRRRSLSWSRTGRLPTSRFISVPAVSARTGCSSAARMAAEDGLDPGRLPRMLMRPILFDPLDEVEGNWSRSELEAMDAAFVARVEAAFAAGLESRVAAAATVRVRTPRNGDARRVEAAIEAAWKFLCNEQGDLAFSEI